MNGLIKTAFTKSFFLLTKISLINENVQSLTQKRFKNLAIAFNIELALKYKELEQKNYALLNELTLILQHQQQAPNPQLPSFLTIESIKKSSQQIEPHTNDQP
ncbi:MAG: hypothetical protein HC764_25935 [Pleurocapsa sp. CRU_1_2]|nr:hypothetical protein [Pleurocapsa sp. CRU_1_2]